MQVFFHILMIHLLLTRQVSCFFPKLPPKLHEYTKYYFLLKKKKSYIFIILWVAHVLLLFIGWIFTKHKWKRATIVELPWKHCSTTHNTAIIRMTSAYLQNAWGKNRKQSTKSLIHWCQYIKMSLLKIDMIQYWSFCFISPVSSGIKILPHYSEVKVICLATMTTIITRFIANMDTPIKKTNIIYLSLILLWNPAHLRRTVSSLFYSVSF